MSTRDFEPIDMMPEENSEQTVSDANLERHVQLHTMSDVELLLHFLAELNAQQVRHQLTEPEGSQVGVPLNISTVGGIDLRLYNNIC